MESRIRTEKAVFREGGRSGTILLLFGLLLWAGCSQKSDTSASGEPSSPAVGGPRITATPNPVPGGPDKFGTTTITWDTGDGSPSQVYVCVNGRDERLFADNRAKGSQEASWIGNGSDYEFRLYAGRDHKKLLATVTVTRNKQ